MVLTLADPLAALVARLQTASDVTALASTRIGVEQRSGWENTHRVLLAPSGGTVDQEPPLGTARITLRCYGPRYMHDAMNLRQRVLAFLMPQVPGQAAGFKAAGCVVQDVQHEGGPIRPGDFEGKPEPLVIDFLLVRYTLVPAP
jgi:hypothetical protein